MPTKPKNRPNLIYKYGWWVCMSVLHEKGLEGVITLGRGRKPKTAYNAWARNYNWYKRGCPGMRLPVTRRQQSESQEREAVKRP